MLAASEIEHRSLHDGRYPSAELAYPSPRTALRTLKASHLVNKFSAFDRAYYDRHNAPMDTVFDPINLIRTVDFPNASSRLQLCSSPHPYTLCTPPALPLKHWRTSWALRPTLSSYVASHITSRGDVTTLCDERRRSAGVDFR